MGAVCGGYAAVTSCLASFTYRSLLDCCGLSVCVWIVEDMRQKEDVGLQGTLAFCTMMWLEFVWTQKVNVNGKQHRIYSSLRSELQSVMRAAHVKLTTTGHPSGMKTDAVDALSLGQMLVNQFAKAPVKSVVFNDEEDASVHRVAQAMATNYDGVVVPIQDYIKKGYPDAPAHARCASGVSDHHCPQQHGPSLAPTIHVLSRPSTRRFGVHGHHHGHIRAWLNSA